MTERLSELSVDHNVNLPRSGIGVPPGLLENLLEAATAACSSNQAKARSTLESALTLLLTSSETQTSLVAHLPMGGLATWQVKRVGEYIREHIDSRLKASDLAIRNYWNLVTAISTELELPLSNRTRCGLKTADELTG
jgi:hypothetical protein